MKQNEFCHPARFLSITQAPMKYCVWMMGSGLKSLHVETLQHNSAEKEFLFTISKNEYKPFENSILTSLTRSSDHLFSQRQIEVTIIQPRKYL